MRHTLLPFDERRERYFDKARQVHPELGLIDHHHIPLAVLAAHFADDFTLLQRYRTYALVRDPMSRFGSSLHEYVRTNFNVLLADLPDDEQRRHAQAVAQKLSTHGDAPITDPALIHFARQSDYIELGGEQIADATYALEDIDTLFADLEGRIGAALNRKERNRRVTYPHPLLEQASGAFQRGARRALPYALSAPLLGLGKRILLTLGGAGTLDPAASRNTIDAESEAFVREFYARDIALRTRLLNRSAAAEVTQG